MTRQEFLDGVNDWWELKDFCSDYDCSYLEDVYSDDDMDEEIDYAIGEYSGDYSWRELRDKLDDIPTGYDFYYREGSFSWNGLDDYDFNQYKDDVLDWGDNEGIWDDDEEEEDEEYIEDEPVEEEQDERFEEADFSVDDLMGMCSVTLVTIQTETVRRIQEDNDAFAQLIDVNVPKVLK